MGSQLTAGRTISKEAEVETRELLTNLRDAILLKEKRDEAEAKENHLLAARGAWDDFKASLKKAGQKVKNAFGKRDEGKRQFGTVEEMRKTKNEILEWKKMVRDFGLQDDPDIKRMEAQMDQLWEMLDLDQY